MSTSPKGSRGGRTDGGNNVHSGACSGHGHPDPQGRGRGRGGQRGDIPRPPAHPSTHSMPWGSRLPPCAGLSQPSPKLQPLPGGPIFPPHSQPSSMARASLSFSQKLLGTDPTGYGKPHKLPPGHTAGLHLPDFSAGRQDHMTAAGQWDVGGCETQQGCLCTHLQDLFPHWPAERRGLQGPRRRQSHKTAGAQGPE